MHSDTTDRPQARASVWESSRRGRSGTRRGAWRPRGPAHRRCHGATCVV